MSTVHALSQLVHCRKQEHLCNFLLGFGLQSGLSSTGLFLQDNVASEPKNYQKPPIQPEDRDKALTADILLVDMYDLRLVYLP